MSDGVRQRKTETKETRKDAAASGKLGRKNKRKISTTSAAPKPGLHKLWTRIVIVFCVMAIVYYFVTKEKEKKFATVQERNIIRFQNITCGPAYLHDMKVFPRCVPSYCGRFVNDKLIHYREIEGLLEIAKNGMNLADSGEGASVLDLNAGALSKGKNMLNVHNMTQAKDIFKKEHLLIYNNVQAKMKKAIAEQFRIDEHALYLTYPSFFSKITNTSAKTIHDEYWHPHVDKETYEAFHYTSLLYLTDYGKDFTGGRFVFYDKKANVTIEPVRGRVSGFTSGAENAHFIEKVLTGTRYALTVAFTCNPERAFANLRRRVGDEHHSANKAPGNNRDKT